MNFEEWKDRELAKGKQMTWLEWCEKAFEAGQQSKEAAIKEMDEVIKLQDADLRKYEKQIESLREQLNNMEACYIEKKKQVEDQHKKVDEVLEYLDGESANRWGLWKEKADMLDQGASNAFEEAYWMAKKALRGAND